MAAAPQASSRLEMLQARFQQKQLQEKEQKLLQLYDQQQQRAYQVVQRGSAGSTGSNHGSSVSQHTVTRSTTTTHSTTTSQGGKVRQMFDERRQTTVKGIDRSYPLEPLDNKPRKPTANGTGHATTKSNDGTVNRQTITVRRVARADVNSNINGGKPLISYREEISREEYHGDDNEFGNENDNDGRRYANGNRSNADRNEVSIEEVTDDDDTIGRNRMMAKIHLMDFDKDMKCRVNNDLESEQFPEDLMVDVPDKLTKRYPMRKISQAEARLERFKNANTRRSNVTRAANATTTTTTTTTTTKKRSEPMFGPTGTSSRESVTRTRTVGTPEPAQRPVQSPSPKPANRVSKDSESSRSKSKRPKSVAERPEIVKAGPVESLQTASKRKCQAVKSINSESKIDRVTVDTGSSVGLAREIIRESSSRTVKTTFPKIEIRTRKSEGFETIAIKRSDRRDKSPQVALKHSKESTVQPIKTISKSVDLTNETLRSIELASRKTSRSESPKMNIQTTDKRSNKRTEISVRENRPVPACRTLRTTERRSDSKTERKESMEKIDLHSSEPNDIVRSAELVRKANRNQNPSEEMKSTKSDRNYLKSTESSSRSASGSARKINQSTSSSPKIMNKSQKKPVEQKNAIRPRKETEQFVEVRENREVKRGEGPELVRGTSPRSVLSQSKSVGIEKKGTDRTIERVQRTGSKASPAATHRISKDTVTISDDTSVKIDSRQTKFDKKTSIEETQRSRSSLTSHSPVSSEKANLAKSNRINRKFMGEDVCGQSTSEGRKSPSVRRLCRDTINRETSDLERSRENSKHAENLKSKSPDRKVISKKSNDMENGIERSRVTGASRKYLKETGNDRRTSPKRTVDLTDGLRETITVSRKDDIDEYRKSSDIEHGKDKALRSTELVQKVIRKHGLESSESRDSRESELRCSEPSRLDYLEQEVRSPEIEREIENVEKLESSHEGPNLDSSESSPKTSVSAEIDTERQEIVIADQCIERIQGSTREDIRPKKASSQEKSKSRSASVKNKSTDSRSRNEREKSVHNRSTFLIRKPVRKRTSVLGSNIYETNRASAMKKQDDTWETRKTKQFTEPTRKSNEGKVLDCKKESVSSRKVTESFKHVFPTCEVSEPIKTSPEWIKSEEKLRSAELVCKAMHGQNSDLKTEVTSTDRSVESVREPIQMRKSKPTLAPNVEKPQKTVLKSSTYTVKGKHSIIGLQKPKPIVAKRRICSKLHQQHAETNLERARTVRSTHSGSINAREKSIPRGRSASGKKGAKVEVSKRPFKSEKSKRSDSPDGKPTGSCTTRANTEDAFRSIELVRKAIRDQSPEIRRGTSVLADTKRKTRQRSKSSKIFSGEVEISKIDSHKIVKKQSVEVTISKVRKPKTDSVHRDTMKNKERKISQETVGKLCKQVASRTEFNIDTLKLVDDNLRNSKIHSQPADKRSEEPLKRRICDRKPQRKDRISRKTDSEETSLKNLTRKPRIPEQFETIDSKQSGKVTSSGELRADTPTQKASRIPVAQTKSKVKRSDCTKVLQSTVLVPTAMQNKTVELAIEIKPKQRESITTKHNVGSFDKPGVEKNLEKQKQNIVKRKKTSRDKRPVLNSQKRHKLIEQTDQTTLTVKRPIGRNKQLVALKRNVDCSRKTENNEPSESEGKESIKRKVQMPEIISQKTAFYVDSNKSQETENIVLKRMNVDESLQLEGVSRQASQTDSDNIKLPRIDNASTDSIESALRRFDSIGIDTESQEITKLDASDISKQNHTSNSGSSLIETPTKDVESSEIRSKPEDTVIITPIRKVVTEPVRVVSKTSPLEEKLVRKYSNIGKIMKRKTENSVDKKQPFPTARLCIKLKTQIKSNKGSESVRVRTTGKRLVKTRDSIELAQRSVEIRKPSCRRKLFEDSDEKIELGRPKSVDFDFTMEKIEQTERSADIEGKIDRNENQRMTSKICKIVAPKERSNFKYSQSVTPLRSIKVIRESIRNQSPDRFVKVDSNLTNVKNTKSGSTREPDRNETSTIVKAKSPTRFVSPLTRNKENTAREIIKDSIIQKKPELKKNSKVTETDVKKSMETMSIRQPIVVEHQQQIKDVENTKIQKTEVKREPKSTKIVMTTTSQLENRDKQRKSEKVTRSTLVSKRPQRKIVKPLSTTSKSSDSSPEGKRLVESKAKGPLKSIATRRSTISTLPQNQQISKKPTLTKSHVTQRESTKIDRNRSIVKKIVGSFENKRKQIENQNSRNAIEISKETFSVQTHFHDESCTEEEVRFDYERTGRTEHSMGSRSGSPDSLEADSGYRTTANARYSTADSTQSPDHDESPPIIRRLYKSTESSDDSLTACRIYDRRTNKIETTTKLEGNSDRDQSPESMESRSGSPDSLEANYNRRKITRNERHSPLDQSRGLDRGQSKEYSRRTTKEITIESCSGSQDSLEIEPNYTKSVELSKYSAEFTINRDPNEKLKAPRNISKVEHSEIDSKYSKPEQTLIKTSTRPLRITKSPSPDSTLRKSSESRMRTPASSVRRNVFSSPSKSPEVAARGPAGVKSPEPKFTIRKLPTATTKNQNVSNSFDVVDASNLQVDTQLRNSDQESKFENESTSKSENLALDLDAPTSESKLSNAESPKKALPRKQSADKLVTTPKQRSPMTPLHPRPTSSLSTGSNASSGRGQINVGGKGKMAAKSKSSPAHGVTASRAFSARNESSGGNDALTACKICGRRFAPDRVALHEQICAKTGQKKRKQFDTVMFRVKGTELEPFVKKGLSRKSTESKKKKPEVKSNWRRKHEDFINAIRSAKQVQAHLAAGGKLSDLPPPPASDTSDYVQCPHCGRKFNQSAAERHIPKCETMLHNKPNPRAPPKPKR